MNTEINAQGIGLGLTICNKILNQFKSQLEVNSTFGKGTEFYFFLDLKVNEQHLNKESRSDSQ